MRIIAGRLRGRKLKAPRGLTTRPVLARVREALFNVLGDVSGLRVLDLYAGTGAIGIEALSRCAESLVLIDRGYKQCRIIHENLSVCGENAVVIHSDVFKALKKLHVEGRIFDFIFADPPYEKSLAYKTIHSVFDLGLLSASGVMAVTVRHNETLPQKEGHYEIIFDRRYSDTRLVIYKMERERHEL